jgi:hypothetical protein
MPRDFKESLIADVSSEFETGRMNVQEQQHKTLRRMHSLFVMLLVFVLVMGRNYKKRLQSREYHTPSSSTSSTMWFNTGKLPRVGTKMSRLSTKRNSSATLRSLPEILRRVQYSSTSYLQANIGLTTTLQHRGKQPWSGSMWHPQEKEIRGNTDYKQSHSHPLLVFWRSTPYRLPSA